MLAEYATRAAELKHFTPEENVPIQTKSFFSDEKNLNQDQKTNSQNNR
jgi:hypothetical protein